MDLARASMDYSIRITELVKYLREEGKDFPLCDELLHCGVEAGMLLREPPDRPRAPALLKRADYLLEMAAVAGYLTPRQTSRIRADGQRLMELIREKEEGGVS